MAYPHQPQMHTEANSIVNWKLMRSLFNDVAQGIITKKEYIKRVVEVGISPNSPLILILDDDNSAIYKIVDKIRPALRNSQISLSSSNVLATFNNYIVAQSIGPKDGRPFYAAHPDFIKL